MIERAIENWLINTNEENYQLPFCHLLLNKGYQIIYISKHGPFERGKDIIAVNTEGENCAYQLKTRNIDTDDWREIKGEIDELVELIPRIPNFPGNTLHKCYIVTNGDVADPVKDQIDSRNRDNIEKKRKYPKLDIIDLNILLNDFIAAQKHFLPEKISDFRSFLNMLTADGKDMLDKDNFAHFLNNTIFSNLNNSKQAVTNTIYSSVIITSYLLQPFQESKNYYALFEAWVILYASIIRYHVKNKAKLKKIKNCLNLILDEIIICLELLNNETINRKNLLEGKILADGDIIYKARTTMVLGALAILNLVKVQQKKEENSSIEFIQQVDKYFKHLCFWGESAFPYLFFIIKSLEVSERYDFSDKLLLDLFKSILEYNAYDSESGIPNVYYSVDQILDEYFKFTFINRKNFTGSSYILESLIEMNVRRNNKDFIKKHWRSSSHISLKEFQPLKHEDYLLWRTTDGKNITKYLNTPEKWSDLYDRSYNIKTISELFKEIEDFLPFFILVFPHRATTEIIRFLDCKYQNSNSRDKE